MNEFLDAYLAAIDERLLVHLDGSGELRLDTVARLHQYTNALLDGSVSPAALAEDWPDWYLLAAAFVTVYAPGEVDDLEEQTTFLDAVARGEDAPLTDADRAYLWALRSHLGTHRVEPATEE